MRALVAEDSGVIRSIFKRAFAALSVENVDEAADGREAILLVESRTYDLVVTDWNMPFNTGLDVIKAARAAGQTCPIVLQTTESDKAYLMQAIAAGINDFILKPFDREHLVGRLERHVIVARENRLTERCSDPAASERMFADRSRDSSEGD